MNKNILLKKTKSVENFLINKFEPINFNVKLSRNRSNNLFLINSNNSSNNNKNTTSNNFNTNYNINNLKIYSWSTKYLLNNTKYSQESKDINSKQIKLEKFKKQFRINPISPISYNKYQNNSIFKTQEKKNYKIHSIDSDIKRKEFLYKKIFYYWQDKRKNYKRKEKKFINNKINLEYAENENIFDEKLKKKNEELISQGKKIKHFSGPSFAETKLKETIQKVKFMKSVVDYSYPKFVINKIKEIDKLLNIKKKDFLKQIINPFLIKKMKENYI